MAGLARLGGNRPDRGRARGQALHHIKDDGLGAIAEQELLRAREFLDRFDRGAGLAGVVGHDLVQKKRDQGYALDPR